MRFLSQSEVIRAILLDIVHVEVRRRSGHRLPALGSLRRLLAEQEVLARLAVGETVVLLHPPLPLVGVSMAMERERQQNDSLVNG